IQYGGNTPLICPLSTMQMPQVEYPGSSASFPITRVYLKKHRCFCPDLDAEDRLRHQPVKRISLISSGGSESIPLNSFPDISQFRPPSPLKPFQLEGRQKSGSPGTSEQVRLLLFDRYQAPCLFQCFKLAFTGSGSLPRKFLKAAGFAARFKSESTHFNS